MSQAHKGVLLVNLGTPDSPSVKDVRKYLREFLMDRRVMDIPFVQRFFLVQCIIAPFRSFQSAKIYKELWTEEGSPLKTYGFQVKDLLQKALGDRFQVAFGMRYQSPYLCSALDELKDRGLKEIIVIPLYPQYASSSTGSTIEKVFEAIKEWEVTPSLRVVSQFHRHPRFIDAFSEIGRKYTASQRYDHYLFSYHGLPERQIQKASCERYCQLNDRCCSVYHAKNQYCYRAQCFETTRNLVQQLNIAEDDYTVCFQSRLGKMPWIKPYTDEVIPDLIKQGKKRVLVFSPSFIADCLETTIEIGVEYKRLFDGLGGERWDMVESLNTHPLWIECLKGIVLNENESCIKH